MRIIPIANPRGVTPLANLGQFKIEPAKKRSTPMKTKAVLPEEGRMSLNALMGSGGFLTMSDDPSLESLQEVLTPLWARGAF